MKSISTQALTRCQKVKSRGEREIWNPYIKFREEKREMLRFVFKISLYLLEIRENCRFFFAKILVLFSNQKTDLDISLLEIRYMDSIFLFLFSISLFGISSMPWSPSVKHVLEVLEWFYMLTEKKLFQNRSLPFLNAHGLVIPIRERLLKDHTFAIFQNPTLHKKTRKCPHSRLITGDLARFAPKICWVGLK